MTTLNPILDAYAEGITTREQLVQSLVGVGLSSQVVDILVRKAEHKRSQMQEANAEKEGLICDAGDEFKLYSRLLSVVKNPEWADGWKQE